MASRHPPRVVEWADRFAPDLEVFEAIASQTLAQLPREIVDQCGHLQITLCEFADDAILDAMGIEDPFELMGLFEGSGLSQGAAELLTGQMPNRIWLFRRPILDYWASGTESLGNVIAHVLIHEIGHHFGLSDEDMDAIEAAAGD